MERQPAAKFERNPSRRHRQSTRSTSAAHPMLELQRSIGNRATQHLIRSPFIQAKLRVSTPEEPSELEADRVADSVMRMSQPTVFRQAVAQPLSSQITPLVQRETDRVDEDEETIVRKSKSHIPVAVLEDDEEEEQTVQRVRDECEDEMVRRKDNDDDEERVERDADTGAKSQPSTNVIAKSIGALDGQGSPLSEPTRSFFEPRFATDFTHVRIHTDTRAAETARSINAKAFTVGRNIAFGSGQYAPHSHEGQRLLAHELTHVIQQNGAQTNVASDHIQRDPETENAIPPLWDKVNIGYSKLMGNLARINQKAPTVTRSRLNDELWAYASQVGGPGEKTDAELNRLQTTLERFEKRVQTLNDDAQAQWGDLIAKYQSEERRLSKLVDEPASVKALEILDKEYFGTMRRVDLAEEFLVDEDLIQFQHMLNTAKHVQLGELYESRKQLGPKEVSASDTGEGIRATGDVSVAVGATMTSEAGLREVYQKGAREITKAALRDVGKGVPVERVARWAHQARNDLKVLIRSKGSSIVRGMAEARNINKYGNKIGPTYEELIRKGKTPTDIIGSAGKADVKTNRVASKLKVGGRLLLAIDIAIVTWEVFTAPEGERLKTAVSGVAGIGGAAAGAWAGAKLGGTFGSFFGPVGTVVGGVLGLIGGALFGGWAGRKAGAAVYDFFDELANPGSDWDDFSSGVDEAEDAYFEAHTGGQE